MVLPSRIWKIITDRSPHEWNRKHHALNWTRHGIIILLREKLRFTWFTNPWEQYTTETRHNKMISIVHYILLKSKCSSIKSSNMSPIARLWSDVLDILSWFEMIRTRSLPKDGSSSIKMRRSFSSSVSSMICCPQTMSEILRHKHTGVLSDIFDTQSDIFWRECTDLSNSWSCFSSREF